MHRWNPRKIQRSSPFPVDAGFKDPGWREPHAAPTRAYSFYQGDEEVARALLQRDLRTPEERLEFPDELFFGEPFDNSRPVTLLSFFEVTERRRGQGIGNEAARLVENEHRRENLFLAVETQQALGFWSSRGWNKRLPTVLMSPDVISFMDKPAR